MSGRQAPMALEYAVDGFAHNRAVGLVETEHKRFVVLVHPGNHHEKQVWFPPLPYDNTLRKGIANFFLDVLGTKGKAPFCAHDFAKRLSGRRRSAALWVFDV